MSSFFKPEYIFAAFLFFFLIFTLKKELNDILFYKKRNWDFDIDNDNVDDIYDGDSTNKSSNRSRVLFGRPFIILFNILFIFILVAGQHD